MNIINLLYLCFFFYIQKYHHLHCYLIRFITLCLIYENETAIVLYCSSLSPAACGFVCVVHACVFVYVYVNTYVCICLCLCMCVYVICVLPCILKPETDTGCSALCLYNLRQGLSLNWLPSSSSNSLVIVPHITELTALSDNAWLCIWVLGNQTRVHML